MKKIFLVCSKWCYQYVPNIQNRLEQLGYEVILPNYFDEPMIEEKIKREMSREEHIEFCRNSFLESQEKSKKSDAILVLNCDKVKEDIVYNNYIGGATFLEMYDFYLLNHPIFLYHDIPDGMLFDEIEGMNPIILNENLFSIVEHDDFSSISKDNHLLRYFSLEDLMKIKECEDEYLKAAVIVRRVFRDMVDKANNPYIGHLMRVSDRLDRVVPKIAGLLHDTIEDTDVTCKDLLELGFRKEVVEVVYLVTKLNIDKSKMTEEEKLAFYDTEVDSIIQSSNYDASLLKEADMTDYYNPDRFLLLPPEKQEWFHKKYGRQLVKLRKINEERNQKLC